MKISPVTHLSRLPVCASATAHSPALCLRLCVSEAASGPSRRPAAPPHRPPQLPSLAAPPGRQPHPAGPRPPLLSASAASPDPTSAHPSPGSPACGPWRANAGQHSRQLRSWLRRPAQRPSARPLDLETWTLVAFVCPGSTRTACLPVCLVSFSKSPFFYVVISLVVWILEIENWTVKA